MPFFMVTYVHRDEIGWQKHVMAHVQYLQDLVKDGSLRASGPLAGTPHRSAMLIMTAASRKEVLELIEKDPFKIEGLVDEMIVTEWDPIFGIFHNESSHGGSR